MLLQHNHNYKKSLITCGISLIGSGLILALIFFALAQSQGTVLAQTQNCYTPQDQVLYLTNALRAQHGLAMLTRSAALDSSAQSFSQFMTTSQWDPINAPHEGANGSTPAQRITAALGFTPIAWGENVAAGYATATIVMNAWENSPGHLANLLYPDFRSIGIGYTHGPAPYYDYWVQDFSLNSYAELNPVPSPVPTPTPLPASQCAAGTPTPTPVPTPTPTGPANVTITKVVDKTTAKPGDVLTYTITVKNTSAVNANDAWVHDTLPSGITYIQNSASGPGVINVNVDNVDWSLGLLTPGLTATLTFKVTVN